MPERGSTFDASSYTQVLRSHLSPSPRSAEAPIHVRYHLDPAWAGGPANDAAVLQRVADVVAFWRRQASGGTAGVSAVCRRWLMQDMRLRETLGERYADATWWRDRLAQQTADLPASAGAGERPPAPTSARSGRRSQPVTVARPVAADVGGRSATPSATASPPDAATDIPDPPPRLDVRLEVRNDGVLLSWSPPNGLRTLRYTVERMVAGDGQRRVLGRQLAGDTVLDGRPPVAQQLWYFVSVEAGSGDAPAVSDPCPAWYAPPVTMDLHVSAPGTVQGRWEQHPQCSSVRIWRTLGRHSTNPDDGVPVLPDPATHGFVDAPGTVGDVRYHIVPLYPNGASGRSAYGTQTTVRVELLAAPPAPVLTGPAVVEVGGRLHLRTGWAPMPAGVERSLWRLREPAVPVPAEAVPVADLPGYGDELAPVADAAGAGGHLLPVGRSVIAPVAVAGGLAVFGEPVEVQHVPAVSDLVLSRYGSSVQASWRWPHGVQVARLRWRSAGVAVEQEVTDIELRRSGYIEHRAAGRTVLEVACLHRPAGRDPLCSAERSATVAAAPLTLTYTVRKKRHLWRRRLVVRVVADRACSGITICVRLHQGGTKPEQDVVIGGAEAVSCAPGVPFDIDVVLPPRRGPAASRRFVQCDAWDGESRVNVDDFNSNDREVD